MDRNKVIALVTVLICIAAVIRIFHLPGAQYTSNVMRIALVGGVLFLLVDRFATNKNKQGE